MVVVHANGDAVGLHHQQIKIGLSLPSKRHVDVLTLRDIVGLQAAIDFGAGHCARLGWGWWDDNGSGRWRDHRRCTRLGFHANLRPQLLDARTKRRFFLRTCTRCNKADPLPIGQPCQQQQKQYEQDQPREHTSAGPLFRGVGLGFVGRDNLFSWTPSLRKTRIKIEISRLIAIGHTPPLGDNQLVAHHKH